MRIPEYVHVVIVLVCCAAANSVAGKFQFKLWSSDPPLTIYSLVNYNGLFYLFKMIPSVVMTQTGTVVLNVYTKNSAMNTDMIVHGMTIGD